MSFLSVLKSIGHVVQIGLADVAPVAAAASAIPGLPMIGGTILSAVMALEQLVTPANSGTQKKAIAVQIVNAVHPGLNQTNLSSTIDGVVAGLKLLEEALVKTATAPIVAPAPAPPPLPTSLPPV